MRRVIVHIDRLVLKGFGQEDRHRFVYTLREELGRLLSEPEIAVRLAARGDIRRLALGAVRVPRTGSPAAVATRAARGIAERMTS